MLRRDFVIGPPVLAATACSVEAPAHRVHTTDPTPQAPTPTTIKPAVPEPPEPKPIKPSQHAAAGPDEAAMRSASACIAAGQVCLQHCLGLLGVGDVALAECARAVSDMVAISQATQSLAAAGAPELKSLAQVAVAVLGRCEEACRKQAAHHDACRDCAARCATALKEYRRLAA